MTISNCHSVNVLLVRMIFKLLNVYSDSGVKPRGGYTSQLDSRPYTDMYIVGGEAAVTATLYTV